jgi:hypothetical protein
MGTAASDPTRSPTVESRDSETRHHGSGAPAALADIEAASVLSGVGVTAIPVGAFADPSFPAPNFSVYEERKHDWVEVLGDQVEHMD